MRRRRSVKKSILYFAAPFLIACSPISTSKVAPAGSPAQQAPVVHRAVDGWQRIADAPGNGNARGIQCVKGDVCWIYDAKTLWQSRDGGQSWVEVNGIVANEPPLGYHFVSAEIGWRYSLVNLYRTTDSGKTWAVVATPLDLEKGELRSVWFSDDKTGWVADGVYRPLTEEEKRIGVTNNARLGNQVLDAAVFRTDDGGDTWNRQPLSPVWEGRITDVKFFDKSRGLALGEIVYHTDDGGKSWSRPVFKRGCVSEKYLGDFYEASPQYLAMLDSNLWWLSFDDGRIVKSLDGGRAWCDLLHPGRVPFSQGGHEYFTSLHFDTPEHGWGLGWDRFLYETTDAGANWKRLTSDVTVESISFANRSEGLFVSNEGVFRIKS